MNEDNATRAELLEILAAQAVRLARVEAERDRMKLALQEIEDPPPEAFDNGSWEACGWMSERAEAALKGDKEA
jgi:hypothetical protein